MSNAAGETPGGIEPVDGLRSKRQPHAYPAEGDILREAQGDRIGA